MTSDAANHSEAILALAAASPGIEIPAAAVILGLSEDALGWYAAELMDSGQLCRTEGTLELSTQVSDQSEGAAETSGPADEHPEALPEDAVPKFPCPTEGCNRVLLRGPVGPLGIVRQVTCSQCEFTYELRWMLRCKHQQVRRAQDYLTIRYPNPDDRLGSTPEGEIDLSPAAECDNLRIRQGDRFTVITLRMDGTGRWQNMWLRNETTGRAVAICNVIRVPVLWPRYPRGQPRPGEGPPGIPSGSQVAVSVGFCVALLVFALFVGLACNGVF